MLIAFDRFKTYRVIAGGTDVGRLANVVFPRGQWIVRYVVVWSDVVDRQIAVPAARVTRVDHDGRAIRVDVEPDRVEASPQLDLTRRIERREEEQLYEHYGWPPYWLQEEHDVTPIGPLSGESEQMDVADQAEFAAPELELATHLVGAFAVHANEAEFGVLKDVIVDDRRWIIPCIAVDAPAREESVLIETGSISRVDWVSREVHVALPAATLLSGPVYKEDAPLTAELERSLHEFYERIGKAV